MWYIIINCSHCCVHYIPRTSLFYTQVEVCTFWPPSPILLTPTIPISGHHQSYLCICEVWGFFWLLFVFTFHIYPYNICFSLVWCISLRIMPLRPIHVGPSMLQIARFPFLWLSNISSCVCVCMTFSLSIFFTDEHSGGFYILTTINNAAINMRMHMSSQVSIFVSFG